MLRRILSIFKEDSMSFAEAKNAALSIIGLWSIGNEVSIRNLEASLVRQRARIHKIASANVKNLLIRRFLMWLNLLLGRWVKYTLRSQERVLARGKLFVDAVSELKRGIPKKAVSLLSESAGKIGFQTSLDDDTSAAVAMQYVYISIIHGLSST